MSVGIESFHSAYAPETRTPVVGGFATWQMLELSRGSEDLNIVGMDLVEVSPLFDQAEVTALAGASMAHAGCALWRLNMAQNDGPSNAFKFKPRLK